MKKLLKRYWWIFVLIILILMPKFIDMLFSLYLFRYTALYHINASAVLGYVGSLAGISVAAVSIIFALKQFKTLNQTYIIPLNTKYYYYADGTFQPNFISEKGDIQREHILEYEILNLPINLNIKNIGRGTASTFKLVISYNAGKDFWSLMSLLGYPDYGPKGDFESEIADGCGIFDSNEIKTLKLPSYLVSMLRYVCDAQYLNQGNKSVKNNCLIRKKYKLANIEIISEDILDLTDGHNKFSYDLFIELNNTIAIFQDTPVYSEIIVTFKKSH